MTTIKDVVQIGVSTPEREKFAEFTRDMLGFPSHTSPDGNISYIKSDNYQHRIAGRASGTSAANGMWLILSSSKILMDTRWLCHTGLTSKGAR